MRPYLGFWEKLNKPFFALAPLANVTDAVFRQIVVRFGKPAVLWTEFVSADGLCHPQGRRALLRDLWYAENERPIVAQLFTASPKNMFEAATLIASLGFDGIDINMGCPDKQVIRQGAGAACMQDPRLAKGLILAARAGTQAVGTELPISVKTRLGFHEDSLETWLPALLEAQPAAITIHARTKKEMSKVPARFERVKRAVEIAAGSGTLIIGNGDVINLDDARKKAHASGADGVMLGRAIFGNPWLFDTAKTALTAGERLRAARVHTELFSTVWENTKSFSLMKKHYQASINHFSGAKAMRAELMRCQDIAQAIKRLGEFEMEMDTDAAT